MNDLPDELWSIHELADYFKLSESSVYGRITSQKDFPPPVNIPGVSRRWVSSDVKRFINRASEQAQRQSG